MRSGVWRHIRAYDTRGFQILVLDLYHLFRDRVRRRERGIAGHRGYIRRRGRDERRGRHERRRRRERPGGHHRRRRQ